MSLSPVLSTLKSHTSSGPHGDQNKTPSDIQEALSCFFSSGHSNLELKPLKKGTVYKVVDKTGTVSVLRKAFSTWSCERCQREVEIAQWIAQSDAGPKVYQVSSDFRFMLIEYFDGGVLEPNATLDLKEFAICLKNLHSVGLPSLMHTETESTSFKRFYGQFEKLKELYNPLPASLQRLHEIVAGYAANIENHSERVLCHLDLHCDNIMHHEGRMTLVDYGMTGPDHPYFDLANFAMYMSLSHDQELALLKHYMGESYDQDTYRKYAFFRPLVYLNKITWPLIKASKEGGDAKFFEEVWSESSVMPIAEAFEWIYTQKERTAIEDLRYARAAFELFFQKHKEFVELS